MVSGDGSGGEKWKRMGQRELLDCGIFKVTERENEGPGGRRGSFHVLEAPDWATVVPVAEHEGQLCFLMVRQYRHGADRVCVEFPGGVVEKGESPAAAAARELVEETGWKAGRIRLAGSVSPNPAFMDNSFHVFVAEQLSPAGPASLDEHEVVDAFFVPVAEVRSRMGTGDYSHALMATALFLAERLLRRP